jgi:hypothetical protein
MFAMNSSDHRTIGQQPMLRMRKELQDVLQVSAPNRRDSVVSSNPNRAAFDCRKPCH